MGGEQRIRGTRLEVETLLDRLLLLPVRLALHKHLGARPRLLVCQSIVGVHAEPQGDRAVVAPQP